MRIVKNISFLKDIKDIIDWTLKYLDMYSEDAADLVFKTGMAETGYKAIKQYGGGPALGFWQVEPATINDTIENYVKYRSKLEKLLISLGYDETHSEIRVMSNIALQVAFCRLKYRRDKNALPKWNDLEGQSNYWKRVYNTELGKGTIQHFVDANKDYKIGD